VNTTSDILGVELAGALKNVVAIGAGFFDGLGYDMSSKAAYVSEAAREIRDLAVHLGAKRETFELGTHAWLGDLLTTSFGKSRNRLFGDYLGRGMTVQEALGELQKARKISEGYLTCKSFYEVAVQKGISTPILKVVYSVLWQNASVKEVLLHMFTHEEMPPGSVPHAPMGKAKL
jgi:glycerol-3-phosphate dehydrogenase (NAD(P)+)